MGTAFKARNAQVNFAEKSNKHFEKQEYGFILDQTKFKRVQL